MFGKVIKGAKARTMTALRKGVVPGHIAEARLTQCVECPKISRNAVCTLCGCPVIHKVQRAEEHCPLPVGERKWEQY